MSQFEERMGNPIYQGIFAFISFFAFELFLLLLSAISPDFNRLNFWIMAGTILMLFALANALGILRAKKIGQYWSRSMYAYLGLLSLVTLTAWGFSGISVGNAASIQWIFVIITMCYVLFLIIVFLMKVIIEYAQRQDIEHRK